MTSDRVPPWECDSAPRVRVTYSADWPPRYAISVIVGPLHFGTWFAWTQHGAETKAARLLARHVRRQQREDTSNAELRDRGWSE